MREETIKCRDAPTRTFMSDLVCAALLSPIAVVLGTIFTTMFFPLAPIALIIWPLNFILPISIISASMLILMLFSYTARLRRWSSKKFIFTSSLVPSCAVMLILLALYLYFQPHNYSTDHRVSFFRNVKMLTWGDVYVCAVFTVPTLLTAAICSSLFSGFRGIGESTCSEQAAIGDDGGEPTGAIE